jgi:uncharacterized repeat protein (TIGR01451 family)
MSLAQDTKTSVSANSNGIFVQKVVSNSTIPTGVGFTYTVFYSIPAGTMGVNIIDNVPAPLIIDGVIANPVCGTPTVTVTGNTVSYQLASVPNACSGSFQINVRFPAGTTCNNLSVDNRICLSARTPGTEVCTKAVTTTAQATNPWHVYKTPLNSAYMGGACPWATTSDTIEYEVTVYKNGGIYGFMNLDAPQVVDQVPPGATLISSTLIAPAIGTITQSGGAGTNIVWTGLGTLDATQNYLVRRARIKIKYAGIVRPANVNNTVVMTGTLGSVAQSCGQATESSSTCVRIVDPAPNGRFYKGAYVTGNSVGCTGYYQLCANNNGTAPLSNFDVTDAIPTGVTVNSIQVNGTVANPIILWINGTVFGTYTSNATVPVSGVTSIRFQNTGSLAVNAWICYIINFTINSSAPNTVTNTGLLLYGPAPQTVVSASASFGVYPPAPKPCVFKQICNKQTSYVQGSIIRYRLRVQNVGTTAMTGATLTDALNPNLEYVGNETYYTANNWNVPCGSTGQTAWTGVTQSNSSSNNNLSWNLPTIGSNCATIFYPNCGLYGTAGLSYYFIEFDVKVRDIAYVGVVPNLFSIQGTGFTATNSNIEYLTINANWSFNVDKKVSKDNGATYLSSIMTAPNATVQYRLTMTNTASAVKNLTMIDMLPRDAGTSDFFMLNRPVSRGSQFDIKYTNFLASTLPATTVFENATTNICLPELTYSPAGCNPPLWSGTAPSLNAKMTFGPAWLTSGASEKYDFKAQISPTATAGQTACNTFAAIAAAPLYINGVNTDQLMSPLESVKACVTIDSTQGCCDRARITPTQESCCSQLQVTGECAIKTLKIDLVGGTFTALDWTCSPVTGFVGLSSVTLNASSPCYNAVVNPCFQATGGGTVTITYTIYFTDGTTCVKTETKKCCCTPKVSAPSYGCRGVALPFVVDIDNCRFLNGKWDFGDGTTSNVANTTHIYNTAGSYTATFYYTNDCGEFKISFDIGIEQCPCEVRPCFEYKSADLTAQFGSTSTSNYPIVAYHWDFGDGSWANGQTPSHTYAATGEYEVCLTVYADNGFGLCECIGKVCMIVTVKEGGYFNGTTCPTRIRSNAPGTGSSTGSTSQSLKMTVFPNPVSNNLTVIFDKKVSDTEGSSSQLEIYNLQGQLVKTQALGGSLDETKVSMQQLQTGTYILSLRQNGQIISSTKITKN